jgi:pimeloyl-ACP methyl ester carboxylesterase
MGYSMGARISAHLALAHPRRCEALLLGGLGIHLVEGVGLPLGIADAMEAPSLDVLTDPMRRMFRAFAEQTKSDLKALAACIRGSRQTLTAEQVGQISMPTLISVGTKDDVSGSGPSWRSSSPAPSPSTSSGATITSPSATRATSKPSSTFSRVCESMQANTGNPEKRATPMCCRSSLKF